MALALDHLAVAAASLAEGTEHIEAVLGVRLGPVGQHVHMATHNRLLGLGPQDYLEVIAVDPSAPKPPYPRWFGLDRFEGLPKLTNWIVRVEDLDQAIAMAPDGVGQAVDLARGDFRWRMSVPEDGRLPFDDCYPALIQWQGGLKPQDRLADAGCRLTRLEVAHPEAETLEGLLPLRDRRVVFVPGKRALLATIATPHGIRRLG